MGERDRISQIRYARLNYPVWGGDRVNGEMTETGGEARTRLIGRESNRKGEKWIIVDQPGEKCLREVGKSGVASVCRRDQVWNHSGYDTRSFRAGSQRGKFGSTQGKHWIIYLISTPGSTRDTKGAYCDMGRWRTTKGPPFES